MGELATWRLVDKEMPGACPVGHTPGFRMQDLTLCAQRSFASRGHTARVRAPVGR